MKSFFKSLSAVLTAASIFVFSAVVYGNGYFPDEVNVSVQTAEYSKGIYSIESKDAVKVSSFTNSDSEYKATLKAFDMFPVKKVNVSSVKRRYVGVGGDVFGIKLYTKGVMVIKIDAVDASNGAQSPARVAGIRCGDSITHVDGSVLINTDDFISAIENSGGKELALTVERDGEKLEVKLKPTVSESGRYRAGLWVRDSSAGIGTVTFYDNENMVFAGH